MKKHEIGFWLLVIGVVILSYNALNSAYQNYNSATGTSTWSQSLWISTIGGVAAAVGFAMTYKHIKG